VAAADADVGTVPAHRATITESPWNAAAERSYARSEDAVYKYLRYEATFAASLVFFGAFEPPLDLAKVDYSSPN